jgi:hypothetical protein
VISARPWARLMKLLLLCIARCVADTNDPDHFEDSIDAFYRLGNNPRIMVATLGNVCSIAFFNFFGLSVTKNLSATTRMVLDSIRTLVVWGVDLALGWEQFQYLQIVGFFFLLLGTAVYNKIVPVPYAYLDHRHWTELDSRALLLKQGEVEQEETSHSVGMRAPLLNGQHAETNA